MTPARDIDQLWLAALQEVVQRAAHEVKDALNGVSLNLEVIRSRSTGADGDRSRNSLAGFAASAAEQLDLLSARTEALLFLSRPQRPANGPVDVAVTLKHLASLLVPAAKADGVSLSVAGYQASAPTTASAVVTRLALAEGLLTLVNGGGAGRCRLETGAEPVVRFSHESAGTCSLDPAIARTIAQHGIRQETPGSELILRFPGNS